MKSKVNKTNVVRILDKANVKYDLITYEVDEDDLSAVYVAEQLGEDVSRVFKTLILRGDKTGYLVCIIPGAMEICFKAIARLSGNKKTEMIPMKDLLAVTGYIRGGCSPIGMKKEFPKYIDSSCEGLDFIYISAGVRGMQIKLNPRDLITQTNAIIGDLTE